MSQTKIVIGLMVLGLLGPMFLNPLSWMNIVELNEIASAVKRMNNEVEYNITYGYPQRLTLYIDSQDEIDELMEYIEVTKGFVSPTESANLERHRIYSRPEKFSRMTVMELEKEPSGGIKLTVRYARSTLSFFYFLPLLLWRLIWYRKKPD